MSEQTAADRIRTLVEADPAGTGSLSGPPPLGLEPAGDSSLFGWGVPFEDSSLKVLERRLNEKSRGQKFEVINFAVPGYNTAMEAETFVRRCVEYAPDLAMRAIAVVKQLVQDGTLTEKRIHQSWARILQLKNRLRS